MRPLRKLRFDCSDDGLEIGEIDVVNAKLAGEFPDALDGIPAPGCTTAGNRAENALHALDAKGDEGWRGGIWHYR